MLGILAGAAIGLFCGGGLMGALIGGACGWLGGKLLGGLFGGGSPAADASPQPDRQSGVTLGRAPSLEPAYAGPGPIPHRHGAARER